jgi:hypothetical protein
MGHRENRERTQGNSYLLSDVTQKKKTEKTEMGHRGHRDTAIKDLFSLCPSAVFSVLKKLYYAYSSIKFHF